MRKLLLALCLLPSVAVAQWSLEDLNKTINQTNFIVGGGCSGTLISLEHRLVLTNHHCVTRYLSFVEKEETNPDGSVRRVKRVERQDIAVSQKSYKDYRAVGDVSYQGVIVAYKQALDLALIQIRAESLPYTFASKVLPEGKGVTRGEVAYAVGNPLSFDATITQGIISSVNRLLKADWTEAETPFLQYSGGIYFGNSGGALYNASGELIGVPAAVIAAATHLGLAIPYTAIRELLDESCYGEVWRVSTEKYAACKERKEREAKEREKRN